MPSYRRHQAFTIKLSQSSSIYYQVIALIKHLLSSYRTHQAFTIKLSQSSSIYYQAIALIKHLLSSYRTHQAFTIKLSQSSSIYYQTIAVIKHLLSIYRTHQAFTIKLSQSSSIDAPLGTEVDESKPVNRMFLARLIIGVVYCHVCASELIQLWPVLAAWTITMSTCFHTITFKQTPEPY